MAPLKPQEIVCITKAAGPDAGYVVHSLSEQSDVEGPSAKATFKLCNSTTPHVAPELLSAYLLHGLPKHLACDGHSQLHVVVSTESGLGLARAFYDDVLGPLLKTLGLVERGDDDDDDDDDKDGAYRVLVTQNSRSVRELSSRLFSTSASNRPRCTVVLLSGDGGVADLLNSLVPDAQNDQPPIIGLLPLGTGNALFHSLHKPLYGNASAFVLGLRTLLTGRAAPLPTLVTDFSPSSRLVAGPETASDAEARGPRVARLRGAMVASYGLHASLVWESDTPAMRSHGAVRFAMAAQALLALEHAYDCVVQVRRQPGGPWVRLGQSGGRFAYVLATLVSNLERSFTISPASSPLDGRLRLLTIGDVGGEKTMDVMKAAYKDGAHVADKDTVGYDDVDEVKIEVREDDARWRKVCVDGTIVGLPRGGCMTVRRADETSLMVLVHASILEA